MSSVIFRAAFMALVALVLDVSARAENEELVGQKVMTIHWDTEVREGARLVRKLELGTVYEVTKVNGEWLWFNQGVGGWVKRSDVVPYDEAIEYFNRQVQQDPSADNYNNRAQAWRGKGELDIAISDCNEAIRLAPNDTYAYNNRGNALYEKGEYDRAIADFNQAIRLDPKDVDAYHNRGLAWAHQGKYDQAIADYNEAIRLDPVFADAYNKRAWLRATCSNTTYRNGSQAIADASKACDLTSRKNWEYLDTLAAAYAEAGQFDRAVQTINKAMTLAPADQQPYCSERLSDYQARRPFREAKK
jgi:tetratricopeptide (TPR) repeat protein